MSKFFDKKKTIQNVKIANRSHTNKGYANTQNVDIFNSFNPVLLILYSKAETIINENDIDDVFESKTYKNLLEKVRSGLLIQLSITLLIFQSSTIFQIITW